MPRTIFDGDVWARAVKGDTGEVSRPTSNVLDDGWLTGTYPNRKHENWAKLALFEACQWIEEKGFFDWDDGITYGTGAIVNYSGITYISILATNLNQQPDTATTYWTNYYDWLIAQAGQTMVVADETALGAGVIDGQIRGTEGHNFYTWDDGTSKWIARSGNVYSSVPGFANVTFPPGTIANYQGGTWRYDGATWSEVAAVITGRANRPIFEANESSTQLDLEGAAGYHLEGRGWVHWLGTIAYSFTSLTASTWTYLYIDYSSVAGPGIITASNFIDSTTAPTYNSSKGGWYNGDDRCIFAAYGLGSASYKIFYHNGDDIHYDEKIADYNADPVPSTWTDVTLTVPAMTVKALVTFQLFYDTASVVVSWRKNGSSSAGHVSVRASATSTSEYNQTPVYVDDAQKIEISGSVNDGVFGINTNGYSLPKGM
jgi:hypothetical protein